MIVTLSPRAQRELIDAALYLDHEVRGLGDRLIGEFDAAIADLRAYPKANPVIGPGGVRKKNLRNLRYRLIYRLVGNSIEVVAVMHQHRDPDAWRDRV